MAQIELKKNLSKTIRTKVDVKSIRPKYKNLQEWCEDNNNVYIGRGGIVFIDKKRYPPTKSIWCNPYKITKDRTREECVALYKTYIIEKLNDKNETEYTIEKLLEMENKVLGCWCNDNEQCHGDILIELINKYKK